MALLHFLDLAHRRVELFQRLFPRVGKLDLGEGNVIDAELLWIEHGPEAENIALIHQPLQPCLAGRLGKADRF